MGRRALPRLRLPGALPLAPKDRPSGTRPWDAVSWWYSLIFVVPALFLLGDWALGLGGGSDERSLVVRVTDAATGAPLAGVAVVVDGLTQTSDGDGEVRVERPDDGVRIAAQAADYAPAEGVIDASVDGEMPLTLRPTTVRGVLRDAETGGPLAGAKVSVVTGDGATAVEAATDAGGAFVLTGVPEGGSLRVEAGDHGTHEQPLAAGAPLDLALRNSTVTGTVTDTAGKPIQGAVVTAGEASATSRADGTYKLTGVAAGAEVVVAASGFGDARAAVAADRTASAQLERVQVKASYANGYALADPETLEQLIDQIDRTELNALVVDIKQDTIYYDSGVDFFEQAEMVNPLYDLEELLAELDRRGIYAIARLVCFQDPLVAEAYPDLAVRDETTGDIWRNADGVAWVNAFNEELWDANIELALEAIGRGFEEIQYDYVRFPSDGDLTTADFGQEYTAEARQGAITGFLERSRDAIHGAGGKLAVDIFGYTALVSDEQGIGQNFAEIVPIVDYVCMMIYPSHFSEGNIASAPGHPNDYPYETILESLQRSDQQTPDSKLKFRPWLQDFSMPLEGFTEYGPEQVRAQIDAAEEFGTGGWMLWNAGAEFSEDALEPA